MSYDDDLKEAFKRAAEIAKNVPESMQDAAFNRALDAILGVPKTGHSSSDPITSVTHQSPASDEIKDENPADLLVQNLISTDHPRIRQALKILDRALLVIEAAHDKYRIDGLTPAVVAQVLTEKFRISTRAAAVSNALGNAGEFVDRVKEGAGYKYRIMEPGILYLQHASGGSPITKPKPARIKKKATKTSNTKKQTVKAQSKSKSSSTGKRPGPKKLLTDLIESGYFSDRRTIGDVIDYIDNKQGRRYRSTDLSPAFTRLLRDNLLDRERNDDGNYEYWKK